MTIAEIRELRSKLMKRVADAAAADDLVEVRRWSAAAEDCYGLEQQAERVVADMQRLREMLRSGATDIESSAHRAPASDNKPVIQRSAKLDGAATRADWVKRARAAGIRLQGSGKRFETPSGRPVGVAFANELPSSPNRWWLGLPEQSSGFAVLLCREKRGSLSDIVLPIAELGPNWKALSRSNGQIKFNVRRDGSDTVLLIPGAQPISIKRYIGGLDALR